MYFSSCGTQVIYSIQKMIRFLCLSLALFLFLLPCLASAATYYVSTAGSDTPGGGSAGSPWKTITYAAASVPAGTSGSPNVISVAAGTYDVTGNGESFPIAFANDYVALVGAGSSTTFIDPEEIDTEDALHVDAVGISVSGFTFRNASDADAIVITEGGFNIHHNTFEATVKDGITFFREETDYPGNITFADMAVTSNVFKTTQNGVYVYVEIDFDPAATGLTSYFGNFSIANNTFTPTSGDSIYISSLFRPIDITSGTVSVGNLTVTGNTITGGDGGIYFWSGMTNMKDAQVTVGNIDVSKNTCTSQSAYGIYVEYWVMSGQFTGAANTVLGDLTVSGNTIDSAPEGILTYYNTLTTGDNAKVNVGALSIHNNTLTNIGKYAVDVFYDNSNPSPATATLSIGAPSIADNTVSGNPPSANYGVFIKVNSGIDGITFGMPMFQGNTVSRFSYGMYLEDLTEATLSCNYLEQNSTAGILFDTNSTNLLFNTNSLQDNATGLVVSGIKTAVVNAENNWWGDEAGPALCATCNGIDPGASGTVDYEPWLTAQPKKASCGRSFPWLMFMPPITGMGR